MVNLTLYKMDYRLKNFRYNFIGYFNQITTEIFETFGDF